MECVTHQFAGLAKRFAGEEELRKEFRTAVRHKNLIHNLFEHKYTVKKAVDSISFDIQPGELVGGDVEVVLGNVQATTDQRAQEDGALCAALPLAEYREALCSDLGFLRYASRRLARIVVMNTFRATNDLLLPLENRLAAYLLSQAEDGWFHGTLTRTAETLSTSYRQLTRVMSRFAQAGYLRRTPEGWRLEEPDALQALAESVEPSRIL